MSTITHTRASFAEVQELMEKIAIELDGKPTHIVNMACIGISLILQAPSIKGKELAEGIKGASEWIAMYCASLDTPKEQMH